MIKHLLLFVTVLVAALGMRAQNFEYQGLTYTITDVTTNDCKVTGATDKTVAAVDIPAVAIYNRTATDGRTEQVRCKVTEIGHYAFYQYSALRTVTMGDNVAVLQGSAFQDCQALESLSLSDNITYIGNSAISGCVNLTKLKLPRELTTVDVSGINNNYVLREIEFNDKLETIGRDAFSNNPMLKEVILPASLKFIDGNGFRYCSHIKKVVFKGSVETIHYFVFDGCSGIKEVHVPSLADWLGMGFMNESANPLGTARQLYINGEKLIDLVIPDGVEQVKDYAFMGCDLKTLRLGADVKMVKERAFYGCSDMTSAVFNEGLETISYGAFQNCEKIESLELPASLKAVHNGAFENCNSVKTIKWHCSLTDIGERWYLKGLETIEIDNLSDWCRQNFPDGYNPIQYAGTVVLNGAPVEHLVIPDDVTELGSATFDKATKLKSVTIPNHVKSIGHYAFFGCSNITEVYIGNSIKKLELDDFYGCTGTRSLTIADGTEPLLIVGTGWYAEMKYLCNLYIGREITATELPTSIRLIELGKDLADVGTINPDRYTNLKYIQSYAAVPPVCEDFSEAQYSDVTLYVPVGSGDAYRKAAPWSGFASIVEHEPFDFNAVSVKFEKDLYKVRQDSAAIVKLIVEPADFPTDDIILTSSNYYTAITPLGNNEYRISGGTGTITATVPYSGNTATTVYDMYTNPSRITINPSRLTLNVGETVPVEVTVSPEGAYPNEYEWYDSEEAGQFITFADNRVTGVAPGKCTLRLRIRLSDTKSVTGSCSVTVVAPVEGITLSETSAAIDEGGTLQLTATVAPENASNKSLAWTSDDETVATVSSSGLVKAMAKGTAVITAKAIDGSDVSATCTIEVRKPLKSISLSETSLKLTEGESHQLTAILVPEDASVAGILWTSADVSTATVDSDGIVHAVGCGETVITVNAAEWPAVAASCTVKVDKSSGIGGVDADVAEPVKVEYFTMQGISIAEPSGLCIVRTTYADGTVRSAKISCHR